MSDRIYKVLFLCAGNSANCIMAEAILNHSGKGRFRAFSANTHPVAQVHPLVLEQIQRASLPIVGLHHSNLNEFTQPSAPQFDFVISISDLTATEVNVNWPGQPVVAHWMIEGTADLNGTDEANSRRISVAYSQLNWRISIFVCIPFAKFSAVALKDELNNIGQLPERRNILRQP